MLSTRIRSLRWLENNQMKMIVVQLLKIEEKKAFMCLSMAFLQS